MNISAPFIRRPVATALLTLGLALAGALAYAKLPVASLPQVDFPTIQVTAVLPGASPDIVATSVAEPLERRLGQIADVTQMTSQSALGQAQIVMQFGLDRNIDGAARDVEAAINAARADLPTNLRSNPTYRKVNPADAPILILAMTSATLTQAQLYDAAVSVVQQHLSQLPGIGQLILGGASLPAVRVELNPNALVHSGIGLEDVRAALGGANADSPKGSIEQAGQRWQLDTNDQARHASDYRNLIIAWRDGAPVRLSDVGYTVDSVEDLRNQGLYNGQQAILAVMFRQPGANVIATVDEVKDQLPHLIAALPAGTQVHLVGDPSASIRASLNDTQMTLVTAVVLVTLVVFAFLRGWRTTIIPAVAVPVSIIGTFGAMYLLGYILDNLSLMALTISTGFVVDDAIVVLENIARHIEQGVPRVEAALLGARQVAFTVISITMSLIAVFIPILLMGGIVGRLFREFAMTLSLAIAVSMVISLTTTPMMCALFLRPVAARAAERPTWFGRIGDGYAASLDWALRHGRIMLVMLAVTIVLNGLLYVVIPKGFFPEQDTGRLLGAVTADQDTSFQAMQQKLARLVHIVQQDPAVASVVGFSGGGGGGRSQTNNATVYVALKSRGQRAGAAAVVGRLRTQLAAVPGATLYLVPIQDLSAGGRQANAAYQYTLQSDDDAQLYAWTPKLTEALRHDARLTDVNSDEQQGGRNVALDIDRTTAARLGITPAQIDNTLYDAFGQRQVSVIYSQQNQYHVVMEVAPQYWASPNILEQVWVSTSGAPATGTQATNLLPEDAFAGASPSNMESSGSAAQNAATNGIAAVGHGTSSAGTAVTTAAETMVPLAALTHRALGSTPLSVNHQGPFVATTVSFNLAPGRSLSDAVAAIADASRRVGLPASIHGGFAGTALVFKQSLASEPYLILAALVAMYLVLGVLYESFIHPITILSTLPSAGLGALLALLVTGTDFSIIALIGVFLLIGIVKKNAIMMVDFAIAARRDDGLSPRDAIARACLLRFRPIMMTTLAALLGALPLVLSSGEGSELRRPLGISIIGGLLVTQALTLYTTPVVYLELDRFRAWSLRHWRRILPAPRGASEPAE